MNRVRAGQFVKISPCGELVDDCTCFLQTLDHDAAQAQSAVPTALSVVPLYLLGGNFDLGYDLALHVQRHQPSAFKTGQFAFEPTVFSHIGGVRFAQKQLFVDQAFEHLALASLLHPRGNPRVKLPELRRGNRLATHLGQHQFIRLLGATQSCDH